MLDTGRNGCFLNQKEPACFVHLGKSGDLMILFPGLKAIYDGTGIKPVVFVAQYFADIFEGVSYADCVALDVNWWRDVAVARELAEKHFSEVIVPKWWEDKNAVLPELAPEEPSVELLMPNRKWTIAAKDWESFMTSQWCHAGFTKDQMISWPLVFDRRDRAREEQLAQRVFTSSKPKILVNMPVRGTSVFRQPEQMWQRILRLWGQFDIIDLSRLKAKRIYDLLGLYDRSDFLITSDTATLHLASASQIPYLAFIADGGSGSVPKGNCVCAIRYGDAVRSIPRIDRLLEALFNDHGSQRHCYLAKQPRHCDPANTRSAADTVKRFAHLQH